MVIILGFISIESGLNLPGSPISLARLLAPAPQAETVTTGSQPQAAAAGSGVIIINAGNSGYSPKILHAAANTQLKLNLVTNNTFS